MKNIVVEGPDGSGKSTLVNRIAQCVPFLIQPGAGPPKSPQEIRQRAFGYMKLEHKIFDRHPLISELIYGRFRDPPTYIPQPHIKFFYQSEPLIIYCYGRGRVHETKNYDTPKHLALIEDHDEEIRKAYDEWADTHAHYQYSIPDHPDEILEACMEYCK